MFLVKNNTSSKDISCNYEECYEFYTRSQLPLNATRNCFDSKTGKLSLFDIINGSFFIKEDIFLDLGDDTLSHNTLYMIRRFLIKLFLHRMINLHVKIIIPIKLAKN
ncbi:hypothetical protein EDEG_00875 [Edhazardia aedis USNM 41457]|uniref:Uncharacterized protein n=1 Tax=Edhazardia aedis (strain USNM 41457) TaxID=1003232 RepID=J9DUQ2_EDHAE|nr:hypothetical protein EDEG_00875 [Edhazardia aedis USNM 41457]|eukprot:EJW05022.1 hypothetical protein EDEG_00875 [Edhazardia aedis USNM 41457]